MTKCLNGGGGKKSENSKVKSQIEGVRHIRREWEKEQREKENFY